MRALVVEPREPEERVGIAGLRLERREDRLLGRSLLPPPHVDRGHGEQRGRVRRDLGHAPVLDERLVVEAEPRVEVRERHVREGEARLRGDAVLEDPHGERRIARALVEHRERDRRLVEPRVGGDRGLELDARVLGAPLAERREAGLLVLLRGFGGGAPREREGETEGRGEGEPMQGLTSRDR